MRKVIVAVLYFIILIAGVNTQAQADIIELKQEEDIVDRFDYFIDEGQQLTIDQILADSHINWSNSSDSKHAVGGSEVIWIRSRIRNGFDSQKEFFLEFDGYIDVQAWFLRDSAMEVRMTGHYVPFRNKDFGNGNRNLIHLSLSADEEMEFYARLVKSSDLLLNQPTSLFYEVIPFEIWVKNEITRRGIFNLLIGILVGMFFYNFFVYISVRERPFIFYLVLIACFIFQIEHNGGYDVQFLQRFDGYASIWGLVNIPLSNLTGAMVLLFCVGFFNVNERYPAYFKISRILLWGLILLTVPVFIGGKVAAIAMPVAFFLSLLVIIYVITIAIKSLMAGYPSSGFYILAQSVFLFSGIIQILALVGVLPLNQFTLYSAPAGSTIELVLFSFVLANRINVLKRENDLNQKEIIRQLKEREELQANINIQLERKVAERTQEIEQQKELIEKEKIKSEKLLLNILPKEIAKELQETGHAKARHYHHASVLFCDFVGFSEYAKMLSPREVVEDLDFYFRAFDDIIERFGLEKIKTIGDEYMAVGGIPVANETNAKDAIMAGLEIQMLVKSIRSQRQTAGEPYLELRLGIHTGEVVAGVVGKNKFAYDVWGNTVNIASRLETAGLIGKVNVSFSTYRLAKDDFEFTPRGEIDMKNIGKTPMFTADAYREMS
ncbi:MAG: hypothetical protein IPL46_26570 [Saprospiraceae bacterium]|nr:hypothetical protein [Saprospiraceae bacterium]